LPHVAGGGLQAAAAIEADPLATEAAAATEAADSTTTEATEAATAEATEAATTEAALEAAAAEAATKATLEAAAAEAADSTTTEATAAEASRAADTAQPTTREGKPIREERRRWWRGHAGAAELRFRGVRPRQQDDRQSQGHGITELQPTVLSKHALSQTYASRTWNTPATPVAGSPGTASSHFRGDLVRSCLIVQIPNRSVK
jgi:hypothetical protein